jgi:hypothetical protein
MKDQGEELLQLFTQPSPCSAFILQDEMAENAQARLELLRFVGDILRDGPLYREYTYTSREAHQPLPTNAKARYAAFPQIKMFCDNGMCKQETWWVTDKDALIFGVERICQRSYKCKNCGENTIQYFFIWQEREKDNLFVKIGQYPALEERIPASLSAALSKEDAAMYKNALRMRNFNLGLAAIAYMRRVVENKINDILEVLHEAASTHNAPADILARHDEMKAERRFSVKVDYAGELLPPALRPRGLPNPMAVLHDLASDGLHARSDEECVAIFDRCRATFEYVFGKVRIETEEAKNFVKSMVDLTQNKSRG